MFLMVRVIIATLSLCLGCSSQSERERQSEMSPTVMTNHQEQLKGEDVSSQKLRGSVSRVGVSSSP